MAETSLTAVATAQSTHVSIPNAIRRFKEIVGDPQLLKNGQFIWGQHYTLEFKKALNAVIIAQPGPVKDFWSKQSGPRVTVGSELIRVARASRKPGDSAAQDFEDRVRKVLDDKSWQDGSLQAQQLTTWLKDAGAGGPKAYRKANAFLSGGRRVLPQTPEFQQCFPAPVLSFRGLLRMFQIAGTSCFDMSRAVCRFVAKQGGIGVAPTRKVNDPGQVFDQQKKIARFLQPLGDLVVYSPGLGAAMKAAQRALDHGHLLSAGVVSGITLGGPIEQADHFLPILTWERRNNPIPHLAFAFWDPDATVTTALEPGFGLLFFLEGKVASSESASGSNVGTARDPKRDSGPAYDANFFQRGRFGTALQEDTVTCDGNGADKNKQHRYQITTMEAIPGRTAP